jgi:hypothetical protein
VVPDLEMAIEFSNKGFGFKVIGSENWERSEAYDQAMGVKGTAANGAIMAGHNCHIELFEYRAPKPTIAPPETFLARETGVDAAAMQAAISIFAIIYVVLCIRRGESPLRRCRV